MKKMTQEGTLYEKYRESKYFYFLMWWGDLTMAVSEFFWRFHPRRNRFDKE